MSTPKLPDSLGISKASDNGREKRFVEIIEGVARGTIRPPAAAREMDDIVRDSNYDAYGRDFERINFGYVDNTPGLELTSDAGTWQTCLWYSIGRACTSIPANHQGQELLIQLLEELTFLPKHEVAYFTINDVEKKEELWTLSRKDGYRMFPECLTIIHSKPTNTPSTGQSNRMLTMPFADDLLDYRTIDDRDPTCIDYSARTSFINFSSLTARLVGAHLVNVLNLSPLTSRIFWNDNQIQIIRSSESTSAILAAAQWIYHAGPDMLEMCLQQVQDGPYLYTMDCWARWKLIFMDVSMYGSGFNALARRAAQVSVEVMSDAECDAERAEYDDEPSIIDAFGLKSTLVSTTEDDEDDEDEDDEEDLALHE